MRTGGKFYAACLTAVYTSNKGPVAQETRIVGGHAGLRKAGCGHALILLHVLVGKSFPGFGSVWEIVKPAERKKGLTTNEFNCVKNDADLKASTRL